MKPKHKALESAKEHYHKPWGSYYRIHNKELHQYPASRKGGYDKSEGASVDWGNVDKKDHPTLRKIYKKLGGNPKHLHYGKLTVGPEDIKK